MGQAQGENSEKPACANKVHGYLRLADGGALGSALVEEVVPSHQTPVFRTKTDGHGWFQMAAPGRAHGHLVVLRITASGVGPVTVKMQTDASCGTPTIVVPRPGQGNERP